MNTLHLAGLLSMEVSGPQERIRKRRQRYFKPQHSFFFYFFSPLLQKKKISPTNLVSNERDTMPRGGEKPPGNNCLESVDTIEILWWDNDALYLQYPINVELVCGLMRPEHEHSLVIWASSKGVRWMSINLLQQSRKQTAATNSRSKFSSLMFFFSYFFFFFFFSPCCRRERVPVAEAFARLVERLHIKVPEGRHVVGVLDTSQDHHLEQIFTTIVSEIQEERKLCVGFEPALG